MSNRTSRATLLVWGFMCLVAPPSPAQTLENLARAHRDKPSSQTLANIIRFSERHRSDREGALALLLAGFSEMNNGDYPAAIVHLDAARKRLPRLADYASFWLASSRLGANRVDEVVRSLSDVVTHAPLSPLVSRAVLLEVRAHLQKGDPRTAIERLDRAGSMVRQPQGDMLLASAHEAAGDLQAAAAVYKRVFYRDPLTDDASLAGSELSRLKEKLGAGYAPPSAKMMLTRAVRLLAAGDHVRAKRELEAVLPHLEGAGADLARVRLGVARHAARDATGALSYLRQLRVTSPEADAERLHYVLLCLRQLDRDPDFTEPLNLLAAKYPDSRWRLESLVSAANHFLLQNDSARYEPLYRACYESFASDPRGSYCHWKLVWTNYLRGERETAEMLRTHLLTFPGSDKAAAALYYLGRLAEAQSDAAAAKAYYLALRNRFPNYYYAQVPARASLANPEIASVSPASSVSSFLATLKFPARPAATFEATRVTGQRLERARLLAGIALYESAEGELRHASQTEGQTHVLAYEMAGIAARRGLPHEALRYIKSFAPGYLQLPLEAAPIGFWRLAFPLPFREALEKYSGERNIDPFLMAALIRQESEFNPAAISRAHARGLTQVMAATGSQIARRLGIKRFNRDMLFDPEIGIRLGTYHLRAVLDGMDGDLARALAAYNAGKSRVDRWEKWALYREPSEFIETIPFTETRDYVQIVLRNAAIYRHLYGPGMAAVSSEDAASERAKKAVSKRPDIRVHGKRHPRNVAPGGRSSGR